MKKIIYILMTLMIVSLTGCGSKDDDVVVETAQPEIVVPEVEVEPEIVLTYKDYFPQTELIGLTLDEVEEIYEYTADEFEGNIQKYVIEGTEIEDLFYNNVFLYTDESDVVTSVKYDFFFGNLYDDSVDLQMQDTAKNLDTIYTLLCELDGVEISDENSISTIAEDFESGKLFENSYYNSKFDLDEIEIDIESYVHVFTKGLIVTKSITFDNESIVDA